MTCAAHVVQISPLISRSEPRCEYAIHDRASCLGECGSSSRCADLIVDYAEAIALLAEAQHGEQKVASVRSIDPASAEDEIFATDLTNGFFACKLGCAIDIEGIGCVLLRPWAVF